MIWLAALILYAAIGSAMGYGLCISDKATPRIRAMPAATVILLTVAWPWLLIAARTQAWIEE